MNTEVQKFTLICRISLAFLNLFLENEVLNMRCVFISKIYLQF
jgi:hypothetical protein